MCGQCVAISCEPGYTINPRDAPSATSQLLCKENDFELSAPVSSSPVMCNKPEFGNDDTVGCHQEVSRFLRISLDARIKPLVRQVSQPPARHLGLHQYLLCVVDVT